MFFDKSCVLTFCQFSVKSDRVSISLYCCKIKSRLQTNGTEKYVDEEYIRMF